MHLTSLYVCTMCIVILYHWWLEYQLFYVLATSKVISGLIPTCNSVHSLRLNSAAPLEDLTWYPIQSLSQPVLACPILITLSTWLGSDKYQFSKSLGLLDQGSNPRSPTHDARTLMIQPQHPVFKQGKSKRNRLGIWVAIPCWVNLIMLIEDYMCGVAIVYRHC